jgi:phytanoyl-CoA hydroxylase
MTTLDVPPVSTRSRQYHVEGVVQVAAVLTSTEVEEIRDAFMAQMAADKSIGFDDGVRGGDPLARFPRIVHPHRHRDLPIGELSSRLMLDRRIWSIVEELIGPAYAAQSMFYFKPPGGRGQALHQDNLFLRAAPETCLAVWIAIDDVDADNGGLAVVPSSHTQEIICPETADETESFTNMAVAVPEGLHLVQTEMRAGDALFFHGSLVHGSRSNRTPDRFRRSLIFHYIPSDSVEVARFYSPLLDHSGREVTITTATGGGPCGVVLDDEPH